MSDNDPNDQEGRPEKSGRPFRSVNIDPLSGVEETDREIEQARRKSRFRRNERWENSRQLLVLVALAIVTLVLAVAFAWSVWTLIPTDPAKRIEIAQWILETEVGGLVAGLIGLWAVKSFEK